MSSEQIVDITIIGGGPTGLAAAYYGGHRDASVRIMESLEQLGGQVSAVYPEKHIFDVAGYPKVNGQELIDRLTDQAMQYEPEVRLGEVVETISHRDDEVIELHTAAGETLLTRTMIITAGHGAFNPRNVVHRAPPHEPSRHAFRRGVDHVDRLRPIEQALGAT